MRSSFASLRSASPEDTWLICATSSAVKMPLSCKTRTSGLTADLLSIGCCAQLQSAKPRANNKHTTTQNGFLLISNTSFDSALRCRLDLRTRKALKRPVHIHLVLECQEIPKGCPNRRIMRRGSNDNGKLPVHAVPVRRVAQRDRGKQEVRDLLSLGVQAF